MSRNSLRSQTDCSVLHSRRHKVQTHGNERFDEKRENKITPPVLGLPSVFIEQISLEKVAVNVIVLYFNYHKYQRGEVASSVEINAEKTLQLGHPPNLTDSQRIAKAHTFIEKRKHST